MKRVGLKGAFSLLVLVCCMGMPLALQAQGTSQRCDCQLSSGRYGLWTCCESDCPPNVYPNCIYWDYCDTSADCYVIV
jgi:hypothetical protein